jgi:nucleotide-binding universal stress UspA family protein
MSSERSIIVALEDMATAGVVGAAAAHIAVDESANRVILLHVLDAHTMASGFAGLAGAPVPIVETSEECRSVLALGEAAMSAEYEAMKQPVPSFVSRLVEGSPAACIAGVATDAGASAIVVGARRPHALGRLTHPNVVESLRRLTSLPVHVVPLQEKAQ